MNSKSFKPYLKIVICACGFYAAALGICVNSDGVYYSAICEALGVARSQASFYATLSMLATAFSAPFVIRLAGKIKYKVLVLCGACLCAIAIVGMSMARSLPVLYICALLRGLGCSGFSTISVIVLLGNWFDDKYGSMSGLVMGFSGIVGAILNPVFSSIITNHGYRTSYVVSAVMVLVFTVPVAILFAHFRPEEIGLEPYRDGSGGRLKAAQQKEAAYCPYNKKSAPFVLMCVLCLFLNCISSMSTQLSGHAENIGFSSAFGATLISFVMIGNVCGKVVLGFLSDKFPLRNVITLSYVANIAAAALFLIFKVPFIMFIAAILFGLSYATPSICAMSKLPRYVYGPENAGAAASIIGIFGSISSAMGFTLFGWIYDISGSYSACFAVCIGLLTFGIILSNIIISLADKGRQRGAFGCSRGAENHV